MAQERLSPILGEAAKGLVDGSIDKTNEKLSKLKSFDDASLKVAYANLRNAIAYGYKRIIELHVNGKMVFPLSVVRPEPGVVVVGEQEDDTDDMNVLEKLEVLRSDTLAILAQLKEQGVNVQTLSVDLGEVKK